MIFAVKIVMIKKPILPLYPPLKVPYPSKFKRKNRVTYPIAKGALYNAQTCDHQWLVIRLGVGGVG